MKNIVEIELEDTLSLYKSLASKSLSWLTNHLDNFSPFKNHVTSVNGLKVFSEISLLYAYLKTRKHLGFDSKISTWKSFFQDHLNNKQYAEVIRRDPALAYAFMFPYLLLRSTGYKSDYYEDSHQYMNRWGYYDSIELVPFRQLDLEYFLWKSGLENEPDWDKHFPATVLGRCQSSLALDEEATYSITHTLFYMTDFGNRPIALSQSKIDKVTEILEALLLHFWRVGHYDLMGELLINLTCINKDDTYLYQNARKVFLNVWNEDGSVPALRIKTNKAQSQFSFCYHTTLVGVLLCSIEMSKILQKEDHT